MPKRLEIEAAKSELAAIETLLRERSHESDPIGHMQLAELADEARQRLVAIEATPGHRASLAMFFAGGPVIGSRGIDAAFAGKVVGIFQDLVAKRFAAEEVGDLGMRGPVALQPRSDLLLTNIVRGSVGLVLEEADQTDVFADTQLKNVLDGVVSSIRAAAGRDSDRFDSEVERMSPRFLTALGELFSLMDDQHALLRLVDEEEELNLDQGAIARGRERATATSIRERDDDVLSGRLFLLPAARRFELQELDNGQAISGGISPGFTRERLEELLREGGVVGQRWQVRIRSRTVSRPQGPSRTTYTLLGLVQRLEPLR